MKYKQEEYYSVIETKTGRKICDCADQMDAMMMVSFDPANRTIARNQFLMGEVVDIEIPKALPTNEIVGGAGSSFTSEYVKGSNGPSEPLPQIKLPQSNLQPLNL